MEEKGHTPSAATDPSPPLLKSGWWTDIPCDSFDPPKGPSPSSRPMLPDCADRRRAYLIIVCV